MTSMEQPPNQIQRTNILQIKDMSPISRNFDCEVIVLQKEGEPASTREGDMIYRYLVADRTGSITLSVWGEMGRDIRGGDILRISGVNNKLRKGHLFISTLKSCKIKRVGQDAFPFSEKPNMSEIEHHQLTPYNNNNNSNWANGQQQQQQRYQNNNMNNNNNNNGNRHQQPRGFQSNNMNNNNNGSSNMSNINSSHPYNNRGRHHQRGGGGYNHRGRGNGGNRYHQDLDNPV